MGETLVVELLTEELPPKALRSLGNAFATGIAEGLREGGFLGPSSHATPYATPRRLAVSISDVRADAEDKEVAQKLMPAAAATDASGNVNQALRKRLEKLGRAHLADALRLPPWDAHDGPDHLYVQSDGKADYVWLRSLAKGGSLLVGLENAIDEAIAKLPIPKVMSYQRADGSTFKFVRPARRLLALHGGTIVPVSALGLTAGRITSGHRFVAKAEIDIATAESYVPSLAAEGKVIASFAERRAKIVGGLEQAAAGASVIMPDELLDEVTALVEWPKVYTGGFDAAFLAVPQECLILTMQRNQRYFALADSHGKLQNRFLMVSNTEVRDPSAVIHGNERVLRARLADAKFGCAFAGSCSASTISQPSYPQSASGFSAEAKSTHPSPGTVYTPLRTELRKLHLFLPARSRMSGCTSFAWTWLMRLAHFRATAAGSSPANVKWPVSNSKPTLSGVPAINLIDLASVSITVPM